MIVSASILSRDPLIIFTGNASEAPISCASVLSEALRDREVTFITMTTWSAEDTLYAKNLVTFIKKLQNKFPLHSYVVFSNTKAEVAYLTKRGIRSFFGHHNSLVDPRVYKVADDQEKDLLAVYTASLDAWKRHALCADLASVGIIYWNYGENTHAYFEELKRIMPQARFMNEELGAVPHGELSADQVVGVLNRSRVGLCLSAMEGGMHASIEYLLAGLPVVSTPSKGGRDVFFHQDYVEIADPTAEAVAAAVSKVLARAPSAKEIRSRTIDLQQKQIDLFVSFLDRVVKAEGGSGYDRSQWDACYCDKLLLWEDVSDFLKRIPESDPVRQNLKDRVRRVLKKARRFARVARH